MGLISKLQDLVHSNCPKSKDQTFPNKPYKDGKYYITKHGIDRMNERKITKGEIHVNLHTTPIYKSEIKISKDGYPSYERYSKNKINTRINPKSNRVATVSRYHTKLYNKFCNKKGKNEK